MGVINVIGYQKRILENTVWLAVLGSWVVYTIVNVH